MPISDRRRMARAGARFCPDNCPGCPGPHRVRSASALFVWGFLVGVAGFEPATPSSRTRCSTRLSHTPTDAAAYTFGPAALQAPPPATGRVLFMQTGAAMTGPQVTRVSKADRAAIAEAVRLLAAGSLVAFPTETVYGVGADATNGQAVARIYEVKGRPTFNPLIAHVIDLEAARALGRFSADAMRLAEAFWPGPLTLVLPQT